MERGPFALFQPRDNTPATSRAYDCAVESFSGLLREMLLDAAVLCVPVLLVSAAVGTLVAVVQAATQVQEQTLTLLPKILAVGVMTALFGAFGMHLCATLFHDALIDIPSLVAGT